MLRLKILLCAALIFFPGQLLSQEQGLPKVKTISSEVADAALYLSEKVRVEDRPYIRFFTTYAVPRNLQDDVLLQLSFVCHSLIGPGDDKIGNSGSYYPIAKLVWVDKEKKTYRLEKSGAVSDTLYAIDIRNFNWSPQVWESISAKDGYFVTPVIPNELYGLIRLLAGNAVVRADWFIDAATDVTKQQDTGEKNTIYRELLYASSKIPANVQEYNKIWGPENEEEAIAKGNQFLTLSLTSNVVARHNRVLSASRTDYGWSYRSYDVKTQAGERDYFSNFFKLKGRPPTVFDAGELISSNSVQLQVYDLIDDKGNIINDANAAVARHMSDVLGDARVRVATSCIDCHAAGPIPSENIIKEFIQKGSLKTYDYADKLRIERAYLSDKFEDFVKDSQIQYARALLKVNGLTPEENGKSYLKVIEWYNKPLDMAQVQLETGFTEKDVIEKAGGKDLEMHQRRFVPPRLSLLIVNDTKIPREVWEIARDGIPSTFQATHVLMNGLTQKTLTYQKITEREVVKAVYVRYDKSRANSIVIHQKTGQNWISPEVGSKFEYLGEETTQTGTKWYKIKYNGDIGFALQEVCSLLTE